MVLDNSATLFPVTVRCRDFPFRGLAVGFDCRLSGEIARSTCVEPLVTQSGTQHWRHIGTLTPDRVITEVLDLRGAPLVSVMQSAQHRY